MNIHTHLKHRHLVAGPLALLLLAVSLFGHVAPASLQELIQNDSGYSTLPSHTQVKPDEGTIFEDGALVEGAILVRTEGVARLHAGRVSITGLSGAFHLTRYDNALTVSALTAPVLVLYDGAQVLIPAGWTWRTDDIKTLKTFKDDYKEWRSQRVLTRTPERFLRSQLSALSILAPVEDDLPHSSVLPAPEGTSSLLLPLAQKREWEQWSTQVMGTLTDAIEQGDEDRARQIAEDTRYASAFAAPIAADVLPVLLARLEDDSSLSHALLSHLSGQGDVLTLASVHPYLRTAAWTLPLSDSNYLLSLFALPQSDMQPEGVSDFAMGRWYQAVTERLKNAKDPLPLLESLIAELSPLVEQALSAGYPARAYRLADSLEELAEPYRSLLSSQAKSDLKKLTLIDRIDLSERQTEVSTLSVPVEVVEEDGLPPEEVEQKAYADLQSVGALFTVQTHIEAVSPQRAEVSSLIFGGTTKDVTTSFTYNVLTQEVSKLVVDDKEYPNAIGLSKFIEWVRSL